MTPRPHDTPDRVPETLEEMVACLDVCDQTFMCLHCGEAFWPPNDPEDLTLFHAPDCPLRGRWDVHFAAGFRDHRERPGNS